MSCVGICLGKMKVRHLCPIVYLIYLGLIIIKVDLHAAFHAMAIGRLIDIEILPVNNILTCTFFW